MEKGICLRLSAALAAVALFLLPSGAGALTVTSTAPGYSASFFHLLNIRTNALEFDADGNIYAVDMGGMGSGTVVVERFDAAGGYASSSVYASFSAPELTGGVNGLSFDGLGNLYSSGRTDALGNEGIIYRTDLSSMSTSTYYTTASFRPTGVTANASGNVYFSGRLGTDAAFGNIYALDGYGVLSVVLPGYVSRGVAVDAAGNLYVSNPDDNSIYRFAPGSSVGELVATFDNSPNELTFDEYGNLYAFEWQNASNTTQIYRIATSSVPEPSTVLLLGSGLAGLAFARRRLKA